MMTFYFISVLISLIVSFLAFYFSNDYVKDIMKEAEIPSLDVLIIVLIISSFIPLYNIFSTLATILFIIDNKLNK